jgi:hypothetical protein
MPIVPCFDPTTGASGGPQGGGGLIGGAPRLVGDLSTFTFSDSQSMLNAYSFDSATEQHTFTLNAVTLGLDAKTFIAGTAYSGPKWTTPLFYENGLAVNWDDAFTVEVFFDKIPTGFATSWVGALAVLQDPTSTTLSTMRGIGGVIGRTSTASPETHFGGSWIENSQTSNSLTGGALYSTTVFSFSGKSGVNNAPTGTGTVSKRRSDGLPVSNGKIPINYNTASGLQVSLAFLLGTNGATSAGAGTFKCRMRYKVTKNIFTEVP